MAHPARRDSHPAPLQPATYLGTFAMSLASSPSPGSLLLPRWSRRVAVVAAGRGPGARAGIVDHGPSRWEPEAAAQGQPGPAWTP